MYRSADTSGIADGTSVKIKIVEKDDDGNDDDVATISKILKGRENLSLEAISKIENALDIHFLQMNE